MCGGALIVAGRGTDTMSLLGQQNEVWRVTSSHLDELSLAQESIGLCEQCIREAASDRPSPNWLNENIAFPLFDLYDVHETYLLNADDVPVYAAIGRRAVSPTAYERVAPDVDRFVKLARGEIKRPSGRSNLTERLPGSPPAPVVVPPIPGFSEEATTVFPTVRTTPAVVHASDLVRIGDRVAFVSAMQMARFGGKAASSKQPAPMLVNVRYLDDAFLLDASQQHYLTGARLSDSPTPRDGEASLPLTNSDGVPLTNVLWKPTLGGGIVIEGLLLPAAGAFAVITLLVLLMALRMRRLMQQDNEHLAALHRSEECLRLAQRAAKLATFETDGEKVFGSDLYFEQLGIKPKPFITGEACLELIHPDDRTRAAEEVVYGLTHEEVFQCEYRIVRPDNGDVRWMESHNITVRDDAGNLIRTVGAQLDITEQKRAQEALRESEERFRLAAEAAGLGIWDYDPASGKRQWSERLYTILGLPPDREPDLGVATRCVHPEDRGNFTQELLRLLHGTQAGRFECSFRIRRANDGAERWVAVNGWKAVVPARGVSRLILTVRDTTDEKTAADLAYWSANHDPLTGLANRRLFQERLEESLARAGRTQGSVGLLLLDLDHFKQINDTLGHAAGDKLLKDFAERLQSIVRPGDTIARFGGDEFALIIPRLKTGDRVAEMTESILDRLREPFVHEGRVLDCRASIGASIFPQHGATPEELLKNADIALYSAKAAGRGTWIIFEPRLRADVQRRNRMIELGRDAVRSDRVVPYYQPKLDLAAGAIVGFEALLRWRTPDERIQHPSTIEAAFDDLDVAAEISERMIERTIADMRGWLDAGVEFGHVAVNAAAAEFRRDNFGEGLLSKLAKANIPTHRFQLEVTETVFLGRGAEFVHRALGLLSSAGIKIALDDFGTGYASLRHLKQFPVDIIKIDRSFVGDMEHDPSDEAIIRAVISLGRNLGIKVVAEGIETQAQAERLIALGCDYGQGFLFSKAVPASRVPALEFATRASGGASAPADTPSGLRLVSSSE